MKKRIFAIVMAVIMVATLVIGAVPAMAANEGGVTIRIHYHRPDGNYEGQNNLLKKQKKFMGINMIIQKLIILIIILKLL